MHRRLELTEEERVILRLRFAAHSRRRTYDEVAALLGRRRGVVRRLERRALRKLRLYGADVDGYSVNGWDEV